MEILSHVVSDVVSDLLKLAGSTIWMNIKFQLTPNSYVRKWRKENERLKNLYSDVERTLQLQLRGIGKVPAPAVQCWREEVVRSTLESDDDWRGCFCSTASQARHAYMRTQVMMMLFEEGERLMNSGMDLVIEDFYITMDHYMSEIQKICAELQQLKRDVERTLQQQLGFGKIVKDEVHVWLENVNKNLETAQVDEGDPLAVALMQRKVGELRKLCDDGEKYTADSGVILVQDDPSSVKYQKSCSWDVQKNTQCYSRDGVLRKVLECLRGDKVRRLAIWGMGGIGKKTMMKQVYNTLLNESTFDQVIWVTVSASNLTISHLQNEIANQLTNRPLEEEEEDSTRRAAMVRRMLQQGSYLLILDDAWKAFPDEYVGIPSTNSRFKLVLTTRSLDVAHEMGCDEIIKLEPLSHEEALQLFLDKVGTAVLSDGGTIKPDLEPILLQIVSECGGLPLAIVTVASGMRGKSDQYSWMKALEGLKGGKQNQDQAVKAMRFSYDSLEDKKLQDCFLYCALYPEGFDIPKEELIEYWIEEGYIDQMETRYEMICKGRAILGKLQDKGLLECDESEVDQDVHAKLRITGSDSEGSDGRVKMHFRFRDMALYIMRESPLVSVKSGLSEEELQEKKDWPDQVEKVSLMRNGMEEIPLPQTHLKYNMLTTLLMPNNNIFSIPESFFMQMPGLKVLDLSWNRTLSSLPDSFSDLENLTTLLLQACESLRKVPSLSKCQRITKLDLSWSGIEQVPDGMEMLGNLKYLDLRAPQLGKVPQGVLPQLSNLQHLLAMEMEAEEVVALSKLEYLQVTVGNLDEMSTVLEFMQTQVKRLRSHTLQEEEPMLALFLDTDMDGNLVLFLDEKSILGDFYTCSVGGDDDRDLGCVNRVLAKIALSLRVLSIQALENIERVFCSAFNPLQTLTLLRLVELDNLTSVFDENGLGLLSASPPASYSAAFPLSSIIIKDCPALKNLFPSAHLLGYLQNLQHIEVTDCKEMEEIVAASTSEGGGQEKLALPQLKTLKLNDLPALKSICSANSVLICDSLETLEITDCEELKRIPLYLPQLDDDAAPLALKTITVDSEEWWKASEWCHPNATDILLPKCVFSNDDYDEALEELTLPKLKTVELSDLPAWKGIRSSSKVLSSTGSLEICKITDCPKLKRNSSLVSSVRFSGAGNEFELNDSKNRSKEQKIRKKVKIYRRRN